MYTSLELSRSIVTWATMVLADHGSTPQQVSDAARRAKLQVSKAGRHVGQEAIQLHGGIGMTAEYAVGHMTSRLTAIDHLLGDGREQTKHLVGSLTDHDVVDPVGEGACGCGFPTGPWETCASRALRRTGRSRTPRDRGKPAPLAWSPLVVRRTARRQVPHQRRDTPRRHDADVRTGALIHPDVR